MTPAMLPGDCDPWYLLGWLHAELELNGSITPTSWDAAVAMAQARRAEANR